MATMNYKAQLGVSIPELLSSGFVATRTLTGMLGRLGPKRFESVMRDAFTHEPELRRSILFAARFVDEVDILYLLLQSGAEVNAVHKNGATPLLNYAVVAMPEQEPLHLRCCEVLLDFGADVNVRHKIVSYVMKRVVVDQTVLMVAASNGSLEIVRLFLARGADASVRDGVGRSARDYALKYNHHAVAAELAKEGGNSGGP